MLIGYARVSTYEQDLDLQKDALEKAGCEKLIIDQISGKLSERPGLERIMEVLREGYRHPANHRDSQPVLRRPVRIRLAFFAASAGAPRGDRPDEACAGAGQGDGYGLRRGVARRRRL